MNAEKLSKLKTCELKKGSHKALEEGACIMEMVSYMADEPWSDHPQCACPILTKYAIRLNDKFTDEHRQLMKPFIPKLINTKSTDEIQIARKRLIRWRNVTVTYPLILDLIKMDEIATTLRGFKNTLEDMANASKFLKEKKEQIYKAANAYAYAYAYAYANAYAYAYANAYAYADANAYAYADANAYAYADADAYAYAYDYAYDYAKKCFEELRNKIIFVALETLRLAIEIKP